MKSIEHYHTDEFESYLSSTDPVLRRMGLLQIVAEPGETFTPAQIAEFTGVSRQRIDQIEAAAKKKLFRALKSRHPSLLREMHAIFGSSPERVEALYSEKRS